MMNEYDYDTFNGRENEGSEEIYSNVVRAGRRTYFFDVKATRNDDYFLTITESRRMAGKDGIPYYEKHKIHLYKEDFAKYISGLSDVLEYIKNCKPHLFTENEDVMPHLESYTIAEEEFSGI